MYGRAPNSSSSSVFPVGLVGANSGLTVQKNRLTELAQNNAHPVPRLKVLFSPTVISFDKVFVFNKKIQAV